MTELILRRLTNSDEAAFLEAIGQWDHDSGFAFVRDYRVGMPFSEYVDIHKANERGESLLPGSMVAYLKIKSTSVRESRLSGAIGSIFD